ncbi:MAG: glycoside hydrolase family 127 protein [Verrucomicrobiota bacterium]
MCLANGWCYAARNNRLNKAKGICRVTFGLCWFLWFLFPISNNSAGTEDRPLSPFATVHAIGLDSVHWTSGFWADRFNHCRERMLPNMDALMSGTNYSQYLHNFRIAAGQATGRHRGAPFNDGDFYKWLEAVSALYWSTRDPALNRRLDEIIPVIAAAQRADGYLHTPVLVRQRNGDVQAKPFQDRHNFELYNFGHLFTAAGMHHRATGRTNLLNIARRAADFLQVTLQGETPEAARSSVCPAHFMGLIDLYRTTRETRYLDLAKLFFTGREQIGEGGDDNQDRIPFRQQTNAVGHAVRANYLYAGATDLFLETGDQTLWRPLELIWTNVVSQKMHITGGCGALYDGASPDAAKDQKSITRVHQAYGRNYQLPNLTAHNETCANIGNVLWNWRLFLATGDARYMDIVELALYNSVLSGVGLDGTNFFYVNPLRTLRPMPVELRWSRTRVPFVSSFCCPPNLVRTLAESAGYAYGQSRDAIWVNLYGSSTLRVALDPHHTVRMTQETEYPWNGRIRIRIDDGGPAPFALKLRIPGWAKEGSIRINGELQDLSPTPASYLEMRRQWQAGDFIELDLPMPVRLMEAHPAVEETRNQVAVRRGPLIYCLESIDLPGGTSLNEIFLPAHADLLARHDGRLLGGIVVVEGQARRRAGVTWNDQLYRELTPAPLESLPVKFIPYALWANRGAGEMSVWLPLALP